jgi:hypothetical protein
MGDHEAGSETTITRMSLRTGGWIGYTDDAVFVRRDDGDEGLRIRRSDIVAVRLTPLEWDLTVMSVLLIGVGAYVGVTRNLPVGLGFAAVGIWSLYRTYSKRYELVIRVRNDPEPVSVYPVRPKECHETLGGLLQSADSAGAAS